MAAVNHGFAHEKSQAEMAKGNAEYFDPRIDINFRRAPDRYIYVHTISRREFTVDRAPLFSKVLLRACPTGQRSALCTSIPDPFQQAIHDLLRGKQVGEAHDGMRVAIDLLNPGNPTLNPDWQPGPELAAYFNTSKNCNLFEQGLFLSMSDEPTEAEIVGAERKRDRRYRGLIAHADQLEAVNRRELEEFLQSEDGTDLRMALDRFGEQRSYHKPMIATASCPNCGETIKSGAGFHKNQDLGVICVIDWQRAVAANVVKKSDVPDEHQWWHEVEETDDAEEAEDGSAEVARAPKKRAGRRS